jgi:hypothetical protein
MYQRLAVIAMSGLAFVALGSAQQKVDTTPGHMAPAVGGAKQKKDKIPTSRSLRGTVTDDAGRPLQGALVTLTDGKTKQKLTFITKNDGRYSFSDLSFTIDYELSARYQNLVSSTRRLSQYDRTPEMVRILQVGADPGPAAPAAANGGEPKK